MAKPTKYPDWTVKTDGTDNDVIDPTSGQNNVVEPAAGKKLTGWVYTEKPPRQYFNWLARLTTQWIRWIDETLTTVLTAIEGIVSYRYLNASLTNGGWFDLPTSFTWDNFIVAQATVQVTLTHTSDPAFVPMPFNDGTNHAHLKIYQYSASPNNMRIEVDFGGALFPTSPQFRIILKRINPANVYNEDGDATTWNAENIS